MSKRCPRCGYQNDDEHFFCQKCNEALDDNVRLILNYKKMKEAEAHAKRPTVKSDSDDDYIPIKRKEEKKPHASLWVVLVCLVVVAGVAAYFILS